MDGSVATENLTVVYGRSRGIDSVSLSVGAGQVLGLLGPNGAGKTTWLRAVLDLVHPTSGSASICGVSSREPASRMNVTYLPGDLKLPFRLTGHEVMSRFTSARGHIDPSIIQELAERLGVPLDRRIGSLSKGNRQKVGLVLALAPRTPVLLLDEPTSGLDPLVQQVFVDLIHERAQQGTCIVLSSHVLSELEYLADHVAVLRLGKCVALESMESLKSRTRIEWRVGFRDSQAASRVIERLNADPSVEAMLHGTEVHATLRGSINPLIQAIATEDVIRLEERGGELEDLLREFYSDQQVNP
jgi:ABC-2 type transport system ATP-binding protein